MKLKLLNDHTYNLITNGVQESGDSLKLLFLPEDKTFESIEEDFLISSNLQSLYVLDEESHPVRSLIGYTKYKGMEKRLNYVISVQTVNQGTEENPEYKEVKTTGTVMIVTMSKPEIEDRVSALETDVINTMLALTEIYEGGLK